MRIVGFNRVELIVANRDIERTVRQFNDVLGMNLPDPIRIERSPVVSSRDFGGGIEFVAPTGPGSPIAAKLETGGAGQIGPLVSRSCSGAGAEELSRPGGFYDDRMPRNPRKPEPTTTVCRNGAGSPRRSDGEATYRRVLDAAVASILEKGYYKSSSNEIARRAGVSWGVIQHQFGTRETLLLEVLNDRWRRLQELVASADVSGATLEERLHRVLEVLDAHYGRPEHLAQIQILLDLNNNPDTTAATRRAVAQHGRQLGRAWQPLFHEALGDAADEQDLVLYAFTTLRGYLSGNLIARSITRPQNNRAQKQMLVAGVASVVRVEAARRGIGLQ